MYYVIEVGYQKALIHTDEALNPDEVIAVPQYKIVFPGTEEEQKIFKALRAEVEKDRDEYRSRAWRAEEELKKAKQVIDDLKERKSND